MLRRLGVRGKILATLATPVLVLVILAVYIVGQSVLDARTASQTATIMDALEYQDTAGSAYAQERALAVLARAGNQEALAMLTQAMPDLDEEGKPITDANGAVQMGPSAQERTNLALDERDDFFRGLDIAALDPQVQAAVDRTIGDREGVLELQGQTAGLLLTPGATADEYSSYIDGALDVARQLADTSDDRDLALRLEAYISMDDAMLTNTLERPFAQIYMGKLQAGLTPTPAETTNLATLANTLNIQVDTAQRYMDRLGFGFKVKPLTGDYLTGHETFAQSVAAQNSVWFAGFADASNKWVVDNRAVRDELRGDATHWAQAEAELASQRALATAVGALVIVVISIITALVIARRLVSPLRRLTDAAGDVRDRLPTLVEQVSVPGQGPSLELEPIPIESLDEIGQLAAAFNDVNRTTIEVAREQAALRGSIAEMFVNVARRDQVLLNRQLAFLDDLERSEEDPSTLSNLFRLDHLATRMRRNAESLLVLAGIDSGRRVRQPMPVSDVIRTASSEIELYDRVRLNLVVDPLMLGHNALNAAHLLAELLENATMFSEPHTPVDVTTSRDSFGVTVIVRDHGLGMTADELIEANRKVTSRAASDAVGAQRLGLFVVGRLADRLGSSVDFASGQDGTGTQVTVRFPAVLFLPDDAVPLPQPTDPLEAATQAAAAQYQGMPGGQPGSTAYQNPAPAFASGPSTSSMATQQNPAPAFGGNFGGSAAQPLPTATSSFVAQPEAPVAVPVDLDALTDGTTALGLARRRTSRPGEGSPSERFPMQTATGSIVLPPLVTPELPADMQPAPGDDQWSPPSMTDVEPSPSSLPSRSRNTAPAQPPAPLFEDVPVTPVLDVDQRSALFSSFRSLNTMGVQDASPQALQLDPITQDPAALPGSAEDTSVMRFPASGQAPVAPPPAAPQFQAPDQSFSQQPYGQQPYGQQPYGQPGQAYGGQSTSLGSVAAPDEDEIPGDLRYEALPAFEELMENLPTRRSIREGGKPANKQRGIFGRRPNGQPATGELRTYQPAEPTPVSQPLPAVEPSTVSYSQATPSTGFGPTTGYQPAVTPAQAPADPVYQKGFQEGYERALREAQPSAAPMPFTGPSPTVPGSAVTAARPTMSPVPAASQATVPVEGYSPAEGYAPVENFGPVETFAPAESFGPVETFAPAESFGPVETFAPAESFASAPVASPVTEIVPIAPRPTAPLPAEAAPARVTNQYSEPNRAGAGYGSLSFAEPAQPAVAPAPAPTPAPAPAPAADVADTLDPLDPAYVRDSVEARSEWMASAVLYEEMTSLLRRGAYQEDDVVPENDAYRPAAHTPEPAAPSGLTRRERGASGTGVGDTVDRLSARIERDPEQLRSRLSAFQSATARGRSEVDAGRGTENDPGNQEGASTWAPSTMNHVPDSAPQSR